jgi:hypothetical protein
MEAEPLLPGEDLVRQGLLDLAREELTECALLVLIAAPRLKRLGVQVPERPRQEPWEHQLYTQIEQRLGTAAHSYYNSLIRRIVSYSHALDRERSLHSP